jgi:flagellar M-ring protein FliF
MEPGLQPQTATFANYAMPGGGIISAQNRDWSQDFLVNTHVHHVTTGSGWVDPERSTGAVIALRNVNVRQEDWMAATPEGEEPRTAADWERFKNENEAPVSMNGSFDPEQFVEFHELVAAAMGIPADNVQLILMERMIPVDIEATQWDIATILMVIVLLLLLAMLLFGLLRKQRTAGEDEESLEPQLAVEDLLVSTQLEEAKEEEVAQLEEIDYFKENEIKKHIEKFVNEKPEAVAALLRNWINVEEW